MLMTDEEKEKRKELRILLKVKSSIFDDKHGNEHKCLTVTNVMRVLLEDEEVSAITNSIKNLRRLRIALSKVSADAGLVEKFYMMGGLGRLPERENEFKAIKD